MMKKIKDWFAIENNFNLVRDLLFVGSLLFALIAGLMCCAPRASAAELDSTEEATEAIEITYVPTNVINRFKMGPYIDLDENGISKYDGKYFTGKLLDYFVLLEGANGDYYVYTYNQHGDNWTTDAGDGTEITYTTGVTYDAAQNALIRGYITDEKLYHCSGIGSEWTEVAPLNTQDDILVSMSGYTMIGSTHNVCTADTYTTYYKPPYTQPVYDPVDNTLDLSAALFDVAGQAIDFIVSNPIILVSTLLFIFVAGAGIIKNFVTGV